MGTPYYTVSLDLVDRKCLVVGGGKVAERKVKTLLECRAKVLLISPEVTVYLKHLAQTEEVKYLKKEYGSQDLEGVFLVISATDSWEVNQQVATDCIARNILINVVDAPEHCSFIVPAVVRQGALTISVSTEGKSPALAKKIRQDLKKQYGYEYAILLEYLGQLRKQVLKDITMQEQREEIFRCLVESDLLELIQSGQDQLIEERINQCLLL